MSYWFVSGSQKSQPFRSHLLISHFHSSPTLTLFCPISILVSPPLPESCSLENRKKQLRLYLDLKVDPIQGLSSKWDYEKDQWKK